MKALARGASLLVVIVIVVGGTAGIGAALGLGSVTILAGLTALFCFIAANGGPLRADLKLLAGFAPAVVIGGALPRLLGQVSQVAAIAALVVIVFVAALLPVLGTRFVTVGLGLGMASVFGYGYQLTGGANVWRIIAAPAIAVAIVIVLRTLMGAADPDKPTRVALAAALVGGAGTAERAARAWLSDRPRVWQSRVLGAGARFQATMGVLRGRAKALPAEQAETLTEVLDAAQQQMATLAEAVKAKSTPDDLPPVSRATARISLPGATERLVDDLWRMTDTVHEAVTTRDRSTANFPPYFVRALVRREMEGVFSWQSALLRHAIRCAIGMIIALTVASFRPGDPLTVSFLMTTFAIMQPEWRDTLAKAWQRVGGALAGAAVLALVLWLLPQSALLPIALVALLIGFPLMQTQPMVFNGCMVFLSVGLNASTKHLDPDATLIEYVLLMAGAVAIGLLFGFLAVPGVPRPPLSRRFADATAELQRLLRMVSSLLRGDEVLGRAIGARFRDASRAHQNLVSPEPGSKPPTADQQEALDEAGEGLRGLAGSSLALFRLGNSAPALADFTEAAARALDDGVESPRPPAGLDDEQQLIADMVIADLLRIQHARAALA
ncbi:FUSC family protein [Kutzneria buriramensis]|uniref:Fusaric acid resistance family protein n=1 Tax=Kutzneria buriramensis TaxID=1045776 RepID=A0A3E0GYW8_9PSEU|nr:FUSC family protein [Kutzneria buriramensis]REH35310.1 fusaric acid resistance family protein [Kutzneria buriramensis]